MRGMRRALLLLVLGVSGFAVAGFASGVGLGGGTTPTYPTTSGTTTVPTTTAPKGDEGCTPGFWKNHPEAWVTYSPTQTLASVFSAAGLGTLGSTSLIDALSFHGGPTLTDAKQILLRHAVAALLNAAHPGVDFGMTTAEVISLVNTALASTDRQTILAAKDVLAGLNEAGCPL
jgi:hypothetical protein